MKPWRADGDKPHHGHPAKYRQIMRDIASRVAALEKTVGPYVVENFTPTRTLDMATAGAPQIGNFIATLVSDLQAVGRISKPG
jgi:hypothetical protein